MLEQLKALYGQAVVTNPLEVQDPSTLYWFKTEKGIPFGLRKSAVTEKEYQLLTMTFNEVELPPKLMTDEERIWSASLFTGEENSIRLSTDDPRYLLHTYFKIPFKDTDSFREAILALFDEAPIILWKSHHTALLIFKSRPSLTELEEMTQLLATDFYIDACLFIGSALNETKMAKQIYEVEEKAFALARKVFPEKRTFIYERIVPLLLLSSISNDFSPAFSSLLTAMENEDPEWVTSLFAFFEHGMNTTAASKSLFIHRNSLQYRLEKFTEKTGLDPKQFKDALFIYLALLTKKLH